MFAYREAECPLPIRAVALGLMALSLLAACSLNTAPVDSNSPPATQADSAAITPTSGPTVLPVIEETPAPPLEISIWIPDLLMLPGNENAARILDEQISAFQDSEGDVRIQSRFKRVGGTGGIMATLRTAAPVAPGALPDLTLLRRENLIAAAQAGLIQPLEGLVPSATIGSLYEQALALGQVDGELYGLPYALEVQHLVYPPVLAPSRARVSFTDMLEQGTPFIFPAGTTGTISDLLYAQFAAAGGTFTNLESVPTSMREARTILDFYAAARDAGLIDSSVLDYTTSADYRDLLSAATPPPVAVVSSRLYLELAAQGVALQPAPVPTQSGEAATVVNGWLWVLTSSDAESRARIARFLGWMFEPERQAAYLRAVYMAPSQPTALRAWDGGDYGTLVGDLLTNALPPLTNPESAAAARALQSAFVAVLSGEQDVDEAVDELVERLSG